MTTDSIITLYAAGYNSTGMFMGNFPVNWTSVQTSPTFNYTATNSDRLTMNSTVPGSGKLTIILLANEATYTTGIITVLPVGIQVLPFNTSSANISIVGSFPNPAFGTTTICYHVPTPSSVKLQVVNIRGEMVASFTDQHTAAGTYAFSWDSKDSPAGIYVARLRVNGTVYSKNIFLAK
jgi:hypothetical protein